MPSQQPNPPGFIRGYNPVTDAETVVQLIADSFALKDDSEGMRILNQMRENARRVQENSWHSPLPANHPGYVWVLDGQVVGNITIISFLDRLRHIALIANVSVKPELRGLGIASALTKQALRFTKAKRAAEVWLQVKDDNQAAKLLYKKFGFELIRKVNNWERAARLPLPADLKTAAAEYSLSRRKLFDWHKQNVWLRETYPPDTRWYATVDFSRFSPLGGLNLSNWDDHSSLTHFSLRENGSLAGVLTWQQGLPKADRLWLALEQSPFEEQRLQALLGGFHEQALSQRSLRLEYPHGRAEKLLHQLGYQLTRCLDWMKLK